MTPIRQRIVAATLDCMREHGVRATTTKLVASKAGVSQGSIYNHFTNRSELIVEAFMVATEGIRDHAEGLTHLVGANTVEENLVTLMNEVIGFFREVTPIVGSILGDPELRSWFTQGEISNPSGGALTPMIGVNEVASYFEAEHQLGRIPEPHPWPVLAAMLIGSCLQYVYLELLSPSGMHGLDSTGDSSQSGYTRGVAQTLLGDPSSNQ